MRTIKLEDFDFDTNRSIYLECDVVDEPNSGTQLYSPRILSKFLNGFLRNNYFAIIVNILHSHQKLKNQFLNSANSNLQFIDCVHNNIDGLTEEGNVIFLKDDYTLTTIDLAVRHVWERVVGKKIILFDSGSYFFIKFGREDVFNFVHKILASLENEGTVVFVFMKKSIDEETESQLKSLFDEIICVKKQKLN